MNNNKNIKKTILIDLDGVLNDYDGRYQEDCIPKIKNEAVEFLKNLSKEYSVKIFTCRPELQVKKWITASKIKQFINGITSKKEPAYLYIDDRSICFNGDYNETFKRIQEFKPWYK